MFNIFKVNNIQRYIPVTLATKILLIINKVLPFKFINNFIEYLSNFEKKIKCINLDQWKILIDFSYLIKDDLSNYDPNDSWPSLYDDFVEWLKDFKINY
jgi:hypothetical protein